MNPQSLNEAALAIGRRIGDRRFSGNVLNALSRTACARAALPILLQQDAMPRQSEVTI